MHASDSDEAGGGEELPALEDIRALIEEADGGVDDWVDELDAHAERPDRRRDLEENVWLYRTLGLARRRSDVEESGADAIRRAYELDPTDDESIRVLAETVVDREASEPSQSVEIELLERALALGEHALDRSRRSELAAFLAERLEEQGEAERARSAYLEAADAAESDERAAGMQRAARRTGEDSTDELAARRRAVEELGDPEPRAEALVELAMFWREERDRPRRAIDVLEEARRETPDDPSILEEIAELARALEDWEEFYSAAAAAARHTEGAERVDWLIEAARVAREELRRPERALRGYRRAVELDPARHDAFKQVTAILVELEDWRRLEEAYLDAIELNRESDEARAELIAVLWNNLGDVYRQHLDRPEEALEAYEEALALSPRNLDLREKAAETAREAGAEDAELEHRRVLWRADTERLDDLVRSGELHAGSDRTDRAVRCFRIARFAGAELDEEAGALVERASGAMYHSPDRPLADGSFLPRIYPDELNRDIDAVFRTIYPVVRRWVEEDPSWYDLEPGDRVDVDEPLAFNNIYTDIAEALGWETPPDLWHRDDGEGVEKLALGTGALSAGDELFGSGREKEIAFSVARKLFLLAKPYYLPGLRSMVDLEAFFVLAFDFSHPEIDLDRDREMERAYEMMEDEITGDERDELAASIQGATDEEGEVDLATWVEAVEDAANRVGMLFCDDLEAVENRLRADSQSFSQREVGTRLRALAEFAVSEPYAVLREEFGLARE